MTPSRATAFVREEATAVAGAQHAVEFTRSKVSPTLTHTSRSFTGALSPPLGLHPVLTALRI
jgi:hypothetical protein